MSDKRASPLAAAFLWAIVWLRRSVSPALLRTASPTRSPIKCSGPLLRLWALDMLSGRERSDPSRGDVEKLLCVPIGV